MFLISYKLKHGKMKSLTNVFLVFVFAFWMISCSEGDLNEGPAQVAVKLQGTTQSQGNARINGQMEIKEAMFGVTKIELEREFDDESGSNGDESDASDGDNSSDDDFEIEVKGNFKVDLLNGTSNPDIPVISVDPGVFTEVKVDLSPILEGGYSVILKADYVDDNGVVHPLELMLDQMFEIKVGNHNGFAVDTEKLNQVLLLFNLESWFTDINLSNLMDEDGVIRIDIETDDATMTKVKINIDDNCKSGSDDDDDGEIDDD